MQWNGLFVCTGFFVQSLYGMVSAVCWQVCVAVTRYLEYHCCWHSSRNFAIGAQVGYFAILQVAILNIRDRPRTTNHTPNQLIVHGQILLRFSSLHWFPISNLKQDCSVPVKIFDKI